MSVEGPDCGVRHVIGIIGKKLRPHKHLRSFFNVFYVEPIECSKSMEVNMPVIPDILLTAFTSTLGFSLILAFLLMSAH